MHFAHTLYLYVLYDSHVKRRPFPYAADICTDCGIILINVFFKRVNIKEIYMKGEVNGRTEGGVEKIIRQESSVLGAVAKLR